MLRRSVAVLALTAIAGVDVCAHAGLRFASPIEGATLGDTPTSIRLTLTERPEAALSEIHVIDASGATHDVGRPAPVPGDPLAVSVAVRPLGTGVYTVTWRVVSAIDGHATSGAYAFGVRASPARVATRKVPNSIPLLEVAARWILNVGLVVLIGAAFADLARFGGSRDLGLATAGWLLSSAGVGLLLLAQQQTAGTSLGNVLHTTVGQALIRRALALAAGGAALFVVWRSERSSPHGRLRLVAMSAVAIATLSAIAVHVAAGHAGGSARSVLETAAQWAHVTAAGIWIGGLAALLLGTRGAPSEMKAVSVRRFSTIAAAAILVVLGTGAVRAFDELASWSDLTTTPYGRVLLLKVGLFWVIAILGALNRRRSVPVAEDDLAPLRRIGTAELAVAAAALVAAALLAALVPPASARGLPGISASGVDFATTVRASLSAASNQPGPNRFAVRIVDYDSKTPVHANHVFLRFTPLDDPGVPTTSLTLNEGAEDVYGGSGANLSFDGRWRVTIGIERGGNSVEVPLDVEVVGQPHPVAVERIAGRAVKYTVELRGAGFLRFSPDPERAGRSHLYVTCYDIIQDERRVQQMVVTLAAGGNPARQLPLERVSAGSFVATADFAEGRNRIAAVARFMDGTRLRASVDIELPAR